MPSCVSRISSLNKLGSIWSFLVQAIGKAPPVEMISIEVIPNPFLVLDKTCFLRYGWDKEPSLSPAIIFCWKFHLGSIWSFLVQAVGIAPPVEMISIGVIPSPGRPWPEMVENDAKTVDFGSLGGLGQISDLVWSGLVWSYMVWSGLVWSDLV